MAQDKRKWTTADEEQLRLLMARKEAFYTKHNKAIYDFLDVTMPLPKTSLAMEALQTWMVNNADSIRDLLEPFDSDVRPAQADDLNPSTGS